MTQTWTPCPVCSKHDIPAPSVLTLETRHLLFTPGWAFSQLITEPEWLQWPQVSGVYFVMFFAGSTPLVKVGWSTNIARRMGELVTYGGAPFRRGDLLAHIPTDDAALEHRVHRTLSWDRYITPSASELYWPTVRVMSLVDRARDRPVELAKTLRRDKA